MDKGQESTSQAGSTEAMDILSADIRDDTAATQSRNKEALDIPSMKLPDTADEDSSKESETCTASEGHLLAARYSEKKHTQDDQSGDETAAMALRKQNFQLEQDNEMLRKAMKQIKDEISKVNAERDALRRLKDSVLNTERLETAEGLELVKAVEGSIARLVKEVAKEMQTQQRRK